MQRNSARLPGAGSCFWFLPQNIDAAVAVCEEEHVVVVVPGDLVHLELELLLGLGAMRLGVDEGHHIIFVPDSDGLTVWAPADVDVLA